MISLTRILHLHPTFCVGSGIDEVIRNLMKQTSRLGFEPELACFHAEKAMIEDVKSLEVLVYARPKHVLFVDSSFGLFPAPFGKMIANQSASLFSTYRSIKRRIDEANIIHAHFYPTTAFSLFVKPKDKKLIVHNYGVTHDIAGLNILEKYKLVAARQSEHLFSAADIVISISDFLRKDLFDHAGVDSVVVPPGIDIKHYHYSVDGRKAIRNKYHIKEDAFVVLFVGRLAPYKRVDLLIDSFSKVKKELANSKLIIAASPRCNKTIFEIQARKLGLENEIIFANNVSFENMPSYYSACDIHASCSVWEGFGLPFIEAAACGKPSVGFAGIPGLEALAKKRLGLRVEQKKAEAFAEKLLDARSRKWDNQKLRDFSKEYSWGMMAKQIADIYSKLI